ncbi:hypothetical protein AMAG_20689 [Allomyces macrogynus ATCC 38327]|uniref:Uncharacterized protein n=1 Tax=Allomyces macrogynus (strain ATCC 38327) TaxID=578462 RepID=A0A0L0TE74_ALLM3|nr:hypothetical protein AMAG_20689 [Allomyces macrogynus ATCC 38327]|eukprot:KNE73047.1 hypothetical protein AMAG_20689 [Allomyces macrogynus ATCC 38327]
MSRLLSFAFDAVLVSTVFAGIRRSAGISPPGLATDQVQNEGLKFVLDKYFESGEWVMDRSVELLQRFPTAFERKN